NKTVHCTAGRNGVTATCSDFTLAAQTAATQNFSWSGIQLVKNGVETTGGPTPQTTVIIHGFPHMNSTCSPGTAPGYDACLVCEDSDLGLFAGDTDCDTLDAPPTPHRQN